jgi:methionine synthase II (cobalamin-independent)
MKTSSDHILTSHVGSLPRPDDLIAANRAREAAEATDEDVFQEKLRGAVAEVVRRQREFGIDRYYKSDEEFLYACAEAIREEYKAIIDAGLILQLDDPATATAWDMIDPEPALEDYEKFTMVRVEALNHALRGLPEDRIRFHLCWGSWHGPHTTDIPMRDIVGVMLAVNAGAYSFEAGNVRHEHEWKVWQDVKLPDDKVILPGVVSHATNVVEHPELIADRIKAHGVRGGCRAPAERGRHRSAR